RVAVGAGVLWAALAARGDIPRIDPRLALSLAALGRVSNAAPFSLLTWGQTAIGAGLAAVLNATTPLWTAVFAHWVTTDEKLTAFKIAGVLTGLAGVALMVGPSALGGLGADAVAQLAVIGATVCYAVAALYGRGFAKRGLKPMQIAAGQLAGATLLLAPVALLVETPWRLSTPGLDAVVAVIAIGAVSTALAYLIFYRLLATAGATNLTLVTFLVPITAATLGAVFLGERFDAGQLLGVAVIAIGLALFDGRPARAALAALRRIA
ncbi:MAG: DMT family transporter, partial [Pseudomonadota bacterium]